MIIKTPFDFIKNIKEKTGDIYSEENKSSYTPFIVNRSLSFGNQTIFFANEMNRKSHIDKDMQYGFYYHGMPKIKGFDKWLKPEKSSEDITLIIEYYQCSLSKAKEIINILNEAQLSDIRMSLAKGGRTKNDKS